MNICGTTGLRCAMFVFSSNTSALVQTHAKSHPTSYRVISWMQICAAGFEVYFRERTATYLLFSSTAQTTTVTLFEGSTLLNGPVEILNTSKKYASFFFFPIGLRLSSNDKIFVLPGSLFQFYKRCIPRTASSVNHILWTNFDDQINEFFLFYFIL